MIQLTQEDRIRTGRRTGILRHTERTGVDTDTFSVLSVDLARSRQPQLSHQNIRT